MIKTRLFLDMVSDDEDAHAAFEKLAKQLGLNDVDELREFGRQLFPTQPTYVVFGEEADGKPKALLVEGANEFAASGLLARYLHLLQLGADAVADDPCDASFSAELFVDCRNLRLLTREEVDAVNDRFNKRMR